MTAPSCPVSSSQLPKYRELFRGHEGPTMPLFPNIPIATDLPSLIRTVNILREVLRQFTSSLTINNVYLPRPPNFKKSGDTYYSKYPNWAHVQTDHLAGFVFKKGPNGSRDQSHRAYVIRQIRVYFENQTQPDPEFKWNYLKPLDHTIDAGSA